MPALVECRIRKVERLSDRVVLYLGVIDSGCSLCASLSRTNYRFRAGDRVEVCDKSLLWKRIDGREPIEFKASIKKM